MPLTLVSSPRFADHVTPPGHPERPERAEVFDVVAQRWAGRSVTMAAPREATREELARVHAPAYLDAIDAIAGRAVALDPDTFTSPDSVTVARLAAGAACQAVDAALSGSPAVALVRPPGHHAEAGTAMGFCLYNNVAVAAAHARAARGLARVAIVDIDVHHGNGTQAMFYDDPAVLYVSLHQYPFYPGTGGAAEIGRGAGAGRTLNVPLEAGATDADYDLVCRAIVVPVLEAFAPDLLIVSAGYDAHHRDPLGGMRVSTEGFASMALHLRGVAARCCGGRIAALTEGGYDLPALADGLEVTLEALEGPAPAGPPDAVHGDTARARAVLPAVRGVLQPFWPTL
jgi:acetoin utilization deacetylase AcuC-like enzyme